MCGNHEPPKTGDENLLFPLGLLRLSHLTYEGVNVESMRYECGKLLAKRDEARPDVVAGVPDSGIAHAIGYANESASPLHALSSNTRLPGPVHSCPRTRASAT